MVGSALVQEVVSGAIKFVRSNHEELASQDHLMERLKMAQFGLKLSLERSKNMPITDVALLQTRMELRLAFQKCRDVLNKHTVLRVQPLSPSLPRRIIRTLKPFFSTEKDCISRPCVKKFEWYAEKADKFLRDVQTGSSPARYRFSNPLITQLLEGKFLYYPMASGSQTLRLSIYPSFIEDYGAVASLSFKFQDLDTQMKSFSLSLRLRLSESTDIVGISSKCLQSLAPQFKPVADVALGELAQISTQVGFLRFEPYLQECLLDLTTIFIRSFCPRPLCCIDDGNQPSSELSERFPKQVIYLSFECFISAHEYDFQSSTIETNRNSIKAWPILELSVALIPHFTCKIVDAEVNSNIYLSKMAEVVPVRAVECFKLEPERTGYMMSWCSPHGYATFYVRKPTTEMGCAPKVGDGSKTRRVSKRKR
ncbi:unnamed protein product [Alopecurus aequalis]